MRMLEDIAFDQNMHPEDVMKKIFLLLTLVSLTLSGCSRSKDCVWEDSCSAGRHIARGMKMLWGDHPDSRTVCSKEEFEGGEDYCYIDPQSLDFVPLMEDEHSEMLAMADTFVRQPKDSPGDPGSRIPGIEAFRDPSTIHGMGEVFHNVNFPFDSNLIKGEGNRRALKNIAEFMGKNTDLYIFVEGHCDERGPEAYNLALGSRRGNAVRKYLLKEGIDPDRIFTISYGKEHPLLFGHDDYAWSQNRRAEFKVFHHN